MEALEELVVGGRVRWKGDVLPEAAELHHRGTVLRVDRRGVLVRLDSGRSVLFEPRMLETVDG